MFHIQSYWLNSPKAPNIDSVLWVTVCFPSSYLYLSLSYPFWSLCLLFDPFHSHWAEPAPVTSYILEMSLYSTLAQISCPTRFLLFRDLQWLTKLSQCLVLLDYSMNSFECETYIKKELVHQRKNLIRAMQLLKNYVIPIGGDGDMGNSNQGPIDSVLWDGIRTIRIWCSIYYITCNPW